MLTLTNLDEIRRSHDALLERQSRAVYSSLVIAGGQVRGHVATRPEFTPRTGKTQRATKTRVIRVRGGKTLIIQNNAKHASYLEHGTKPHRITARGKALRFRVGRRYRFARSVSHPGSRAFKFLSKATEAGAERFERTLRSALTQIAQEF